MPGLAFRPVLGEQMMTNFVHFEPNTEAPVHQHEEEQIVIVLDGEFEFELDGEVRVMRAGDVAVIPPWVPHGARTRDTRCDEIDVFNPPRKTLVEHLRRQACRGHGPGLTRGRASGGAYRRRLKGTAASSRLSARRQGSAGSGPGRVRHRCPRRSCGDARRRRTDRRQGADEPPRAGGSGRGHTSALLLARCRAWRRRPTRASCDIASPAASMVVNESRRGPTRPDGQGAPVVSGIRGSRCATWRSDLIARRRAAGADDAHPGIRRDGPRQVRPGRSAAKPPGPMSRRAGEECVVPVRPTCGRGHLGRRWRPVTQPLRRPGPSLDGAR
ncbi:cupin domain-containing protein [Pseudonocardia sp. D17]|uniref:cupin domain-containing protein n=1 Tax=Pseudonocardia sp. D17 TaxID=882661 RepID=UPI0030CCE378